MGSPTDLQLSCLRCACSRTRKNGLEGAIRLCLIAIIHTNPLAGVTLSYVSHLILLFLIIDVVALMLLGVSAVILPYIGVAFVVTGLCGFGAVLCLLPLLMDMTQAAVSIPVGPPGLSLHFTLDPLSACFLFTIFVAGTAVAAVQLTSIPMASAPKQITAFSLAGTGLSLLAADGVSLAIGIAISCAVVRPFRSSQRNQAELLIPLLVLAAVCLLTPSGFAPRFDTIRAAPIDPDRATAAAIMVLTAVVGLIWLRRPQHC